MLPVEIAGAVGAALVLVAAVLWFLRRRAPVAPAADDRIDTVVGWQPTATRVLDATGLAAYGTLVRALPEYIVLAQVPLARFIAVPKRNSYADWLRRIGYQCCDFVIADRQGEVVAVVELQSPQPSERSRKRLLRMSRTLKAADVMLRVWRADALPGADAAREALLGKLPEAARPPMRRPVPAAPHLASAAARLPAGAALAPFAPLRTATGAPTKVPPAGNPFEDSARDSTLDERIEMLEPPPTTWYDDLDSEKAPLGKR